MPEQNGILATERILAANSQIKIIILSMHSHHRYIQNSFQAGASGFLLKDCAFEELCLAIHTVVKKQTYISPEISKSVISGFLSSGVETKQSAEERLTLREKEVLQALVEGK